MKKKICTKSMAAVLAFSLFTSCFTTEASVYAKKKAEKMSLNKTLVTLTKGKTVKLKLKHAKKKVKWSSSDKSTAKVNAKGKVTARKIGKAVITAKCAKRNLPVWSR